ncbi:MAG TPA: c(7)-type cytochrome triheme domain-containing protein [Candidatus Eisenbacteria bacterium]|jgi:c(7)-type cytochrome triheme protein
MFSPGERRRFREGSLGRTVPHSVIALLAATCFATGSRAGVPDTAALRLPPDAIYERTVGPDSAVVFRHATHVALASQRCTACHPRLFRILTPTLRISHAEMNAGRSCGGCHDGQHAFGVSAKETCPRCHLGRPSAATADAGARASGTRTLAFRGPKPIRFQPSDVSPGPVTFAHATHVKGECAQCHPRLFPMKSSAANLREGMHEAGACGACHDGKQAFGVEDERACARCHREGAK